jgi:hypothetical protein
MKVDTIQYLIISALLTDGGHHKQWYLQRIAEKIGFDPREELKKEEEEYDFEDGIAP